MSKASEAPPDTVWFLTAVAGLRSDIHGRSTQLLKAIGCHSWQLLRGKCPLQVHGSRHVVPPRRADWVGELYLLSTASVSLPGNWGHLWNAWTNISSHEIKGKHRQFSLINQYREPSPRDFLPLKLRKGMCSVVMKFFLMMHFGNHSREHQNPLLVGNAFLRTWRVLVLNQQDLGSHVHQNAWLNHC